MEHHNAILYECMMKTINDTHCDPEISFAWAVSSKNTLQNNAGLDQINWYLSGMSIYQVY